MAIIDLSNYASTLAQSTAGRAGSINGNVFFDKTAGKIEYLSATEAPFVNLTKAKIPTGAAGVAATALVATTHYMIATVGTTDFTLVGAANNLVGTIFTASGAGAGTGTADVCTANPLIATDGIKFEAIYAFESQERAIDHTLRQYDRWTDGTFKFGGAYNYINGRIPSTATDVSIHRGSGWNEIDAAGVVQKKYFGNKGLSNIYAASQPYYQLGQFTTAANFAKPGQIDEAVLVYDYNVGTPIDNTLNPEVVSVRTYGNNYDRKATNTDLGIAELGGYSTGFALNESVHLTTNTTNMPLANVYTTQTGVWVNMTLEQLNTPVVRNEFVEVAGNFTWVLNNPSGANLDECVAYLDAIATIPGDINAHLTNTTIGKDVDTWYSYDASGKVVTKSGADANGLYIYNIPVADQQRVLFKDDAGNIKSYSFSVSIEANIGATAKADANAWYHSFFASGYNTAAAVTVQDKLANQIVGLASSASIANKVVFSFDYTGDTVGGTANTDKNCVFLCEGDGGATQAKTLYTITKTTSVAFACAPGVENNS